MPRQAAHPLLCRCLSLQRPDPGREARGPRPPRRRGVAGGLRLVCISRPRPPPPWFVPLPSGPAPPPHPEPWTPDAAASERSLASSPPSRALG